MKYFKGKRHLVGAAVGVRLCILLHLVHNGKRKYSNEVTAVEVMGENCAFCTAEYQMYYMQAGRVKRYQLVQFRSIVEEYREVGIGLEPPLANLLPIVVTKS